MKRLYEGASAISVVFFLIIVVGGFLFGTKTQKDKSRYNIKMEKKVQEAKKEREKHYQGQMPDNLEELEYLRKMNDPLWNYYDDKTNMYVPIPGKYNVEVPQRPLEYGD